MKAKRLKETPKEMEEVREQIAGWRQSREKRTAMPEELWQAALSLLANYTLSQVSKRLNIGYNGLRQRAKLGVECVDTKGVEKWQETGDEEGFVMYEPSGWLGKREQSESVMELEDTDGARMTIRVCGQATLDLVGLSKSFWGRKPCCK